MKRKHLSRISGALSASLVGLSVYGLGDLPQDLYKTSFGMFEQGTTTSTVLGSTGVAITTLLCTFIYLPLGVIGLNGVIDAAKGTRNYLYLQKPPRFIEKFAPHPYSDEERKRDLESMLRDMEKPIF